MGWSVGLVDSANPRDILAIQELWAEYWHSLDLALDFQGFAEELRTLPGKYVRPKGGLLLIRIDEKAAGTFAFRPPKRRRMRGQASLRLSGLSQSWCSPFIAL